MIDDGCLEITHAFPFPEPHDDKGDVVKTSDDAANVDEEAAALDGHEFQLEMMKMLREVNVDNNCVGWYQSMYLGTHSTSSLLENQLSSTLTSRSIFIISSWNSWPSSAAASSSTLAVSSEVFTTSPLSSCGSGKGKACVISRHPSSIMRPRSDPVTIVGRDS